MLDIKDLKESVNKTMLAVERMNKAIAEMKDTWR